MLQECAYTYDLIGNLLGIVDSAPGAGVPATPNQLTRAFTYDALYRLLSATGRERDVPSNDPWDPTPRDTDVTRARTYGETYTYNAAGTLVQLQHTADQGSFTRQFAPATDSNRLDSVTVGATTYALTYDACGNLSDEASARHFEADHNDRLRVLESRALAETIDEHGWP